MLSLNKNRVCMEIVMCLVNVVSLLSGGTVAEDLSPVSLLLRVSAEASIRFIHLHIFMLQSTITKSNYVKHSCKSVVSGVMIYYEHSAFCRLYYS